MTTPPGSVGTRAVDDEVYGLLRLADVDVALPLSALREVVPCPPALAGLPAAAAGLLGAMNLRSLVLPVVDVRSSLGLPAERTADQVVVVVAHEGQVLGLLCDEVRGVARIPRSALLPMTANGEALAFSHTSRHPVGDGVVSVLDAGALLRRPGVPTVADLGGGGTAISSAAAGVARPVEGRRTYTLLQCGDHVLALDVAHVHTTLPGSAPRPSVLSGGLCRGVTPAVDREVPVVDPLVLLGLGRLPEGDTGAGLVLRLDDGYVVLSLSGLLELRALAAADVLPLPGFAVSRPDLLAGVAELEGVGQCFVLDGAALLAEPDLVGLASVNTMLDPTADGRLDGRPGPGADEDGVGRPGGAGAAGTPRAGRPYLTYSAGVDAATPLDQVVEILPFPTSLTATGGAGPVLGVVVHRSAAVPVLCLSTLLGCPGAPVAAASCLLLVAVGRGHVAFVVQGLSAIEPLSWADPDQPAASSTDPAHAAASAPLVRIGTQTRLLPDLDLAALARLVQDPGGARPCGDDEAGAEELHVAALVG